MPDIWRDQCGGEDLYAARSLRAVLPTAKPRTEAFVALVELRLVEQRCKAGCGVLNGLERSQTLRSETEW